MLTLKGNFLWLLPAAASLLAPPLLADQARPALDPEKFAAITATLEEAIGEGRIPGAVFWLERKGEQFSAVLGKRSVEPEVEEMTLDTIFDAASLTKPLATASSIGLLVERGKLDFDERVASYIPEFARLGKETVTVRQLLTHTSGLRAGIGRPNSYDHAIELACNEKLQAPPGEAFLYSDINFILLGEIVQRVSGKPLHEFARREIFEPLGMRDTRFLPDESFRDRIAPTQRTSSGMLRGVVHDPTSRAMGGVAGHAGVFTTAADLARFARMMLNGGELDGARIFSPETVKVLSGVQTPETIESRRGFGWDIDSRFSGPRGSLFPIGSYGHTGWTGTSLWIDPYSETFWMLLSSRTHPDGSGNVVPLRPVLADLSAEAVTDFDFADFPGTLPPREATAGK